MGDVEGIESNLKKSDHEKSQTTIRAQDKGISSTSDSKQNDNKDENENLDSGATDELNSSDLKKQELNGKEASLENDNEDEQVDDGDDFQLTDIPKNYSTEERNILFQKGLNFQQEKKPKSALQVS